MTAMVENVDEALLAKSRTYCRDLTKREAKNFYYGLKLLPEPKRTAMYALYAYMRLVDDIADDEDRRSPAERLRDLDAWQRQSHAVVIGEEGAEKRHILWPAFAEMVRQYAIPERVFEDMIAGQRQDLEPVALATWEQLYQYCYRVASVVGLATIHVFGFSGGEDTEKLAIARGVAFQLTNILRDLREDARRGRCYIPQDELAQCGATFQQIQTGRGGTEFVALMRQQIARAESFYQQSAALEQRVAPDSVPTLRAMTAIYHGILDRIATAPERVLHGKVKLPVWTKLAIGWRAMRRR